MKKRFLPLLLLGIAITVSAQTVLTSPTGEGYIYSYSGSFDYEEYLINVPDAGYLEIDLYLEAYDYGFAVMEVYDEDEEMEYFVFEVDPFQSPAFEYFSETIVVPNNSLVILACYDEAYADFFYRTVGQPRKIKYTYDQSGNRINRKTVYLNTALKSLAKAEEINEEIFAELEEDRDFNVYPNPVSQHIFVSLNKEAIESESAEIIIYDSLGKKMLDQEANADIVQIDLSGFSNGFYILKLMYNMESRECVIVKN